VGETRTSAPHLQQPVPLSPAGGDRNAPRKPCDGPNCSGNPSPPVTPPHVPAAEPSDYKSWAVGTVAFVAQAIGPGWGIPGEINQPPIRRENSIFHPPRA
jgi:hypothetical protein